MLAEAYVAGWCVRLLQDDGEEASVRQAAAVLLDWIMAEPAGRRRPEGAAEYAGRLPTRETLLDVWNQADAPEEGGDLVAAWAWDRRVERRTLVATSVGDTTWATSGLLTLMLAASSRWSRREEPPTPRRRPMEAEEVWRHLAELLGAEPVASLLDEAVPGGIDEAADEVVRLFDQRRRAYDMEQLRAEVRRPLEVAEVAEVAARWAAAMTDHVREWSHPAAIVTRAAEDAPATVLPLPVSLRAALSKGSLTGDIHYFGENLSERLGRLYGDRLLVAAEAAVDRATGPVVAAEDLPAAVAGAVGRLRAAGYRPDVVLLPPGWRLAAWFFPGKRPWEAPGQRESRGLTGRWRGLELFEAMPCSLHSALVLDSRRFFTTATGEGSDRVRVEVLDGWRDDHAATLAAAEAGGEVPGIFSLKIRFHVTLGDRGGPVAVGDVAAGVRVPLDVTRLGYALPPGDDRYHRPGCREVPGPAVGGSFCESLDGERRGFCDVCRPHEWDQAVAGDGGA